MIFSDFYRNSETEVGCFKFVQYTVLSQLLSGVLFALICFFNCPKSEADEGKNDWKIDFDGYEVHGEIQLNQVISDIKNKVLAKHFFSVFVKGAEWGIVVSESSSRDSYLHLKKPKIHWYSNGKESICWVFYDESDYDSVSMYPLNYPISEGSESTIPLLWTMFASRGFAEKSGRQKIPLVHDWESQIKYWEFHSVNIRRTDFAPNSSFPSNLVFLNDSVPLELKKQVDEEDSRLWDSKGRRRPGIYFNKYRVPSDVHPTNAWYRAFPPQKQSNQWIPTGFEVSFWDSHWPHEPRLVRQAEASVQRFSAICSLKDLKPVIRREVSVGEMRQWAEEPQVINEEQGNDIPTYTLMPGEDWPTLEQAKIRLKHPDRDRRTKPQPWGFVLLGVIVGVPLFWAARRSFRRA
jgi:hypothetical protein